MNQTTVEQTAEAVRVEMARRKIRSIDLVDVLGVSAATISRRLSGEYAFRVDELAAVAAHLNVPLSTLLPDTERAA